jgi:hypothetical protein
MRSDCKSARSEFFIFRNFLRSEKKQPEILAPIAAASFFGASEASGKKDKAESGTKLHRNENRLAPKILKYYLC